MSSSESVLVDEPRESPEARWARVIALAQRQLGLLSLAQIIALKLDPDVLDSRLQRREWTKIHRGWFKVGTAPMTAGQKELATLLIAGPGAAISHMTAARRHRLDVPRTALVDVTVPYHRRGSQYDDARIFRSRDLGPTEVERAGVFQVTTVPRTVLDLAPILNGHWLSTLLYSAIRQTPANSNRIWLALLSHGSGRKGAHRLRELLVRQSGEFGIPRSAAESFFRHLVRATGFTPTAQYKLGQRQTVDFAFAEHTTVIEVDSWSHHASFFAYRNDRQRDIAAIRKGWVTLRYTWHDIVADQKRVLSEVLAVLEQRSPQASLFPLT